MVEVDGVTRFYGDITAVDNVSFTLKQGEILGLLGPNAAGKTTLMRIITGFLPASRGTVRVAGYDVFEDPMQVKRRVGYLPEQPPLYADMTVRQYLRFVAEIKGVPRRERRARVDESMEMTSLTHIAGRLIDNISKGYKQRVGIAQAVVNNPDVLILDEPTVGLDPEQIIEIRELIKKLGKAHTIMLSSHILPEVSATCDRVVILKQGRVIAIDTQEGLRRHAADSATLKVEISGPGKDATAQISAINGVRQVSPVGKPAGSAATLIVDTEPGSDVRAEIFDCCVKNGWRLIGLHREQATLEQVFLKLTGEDFPSAAEESDADSQADRHHSSNKGSRHKESTNGKEEAGQ
jgi:ABC-2 type transport system ATP-binding protein